MAVAQLQLAGHEGEQQGQRQAVEKYEAEGQEQLPGKVFSSLAWLFLQAMVVLRTQVEAVISETGCR
ncbi:hypothetical protein H7A76_15815 [Pseudomonas sp. MSSRFD41]|nr:hypothetical protein [Pseudomonas sp. MSSRFD41]